METSLPKEGTPQQPTLPLLYSHMDKVEVVEALNLNKGMPLKLKVIIR